VKESDDVSEISLVIAYKQNILLGKSFQVLGSIDVQFVYPHQTRIRKYANDRVDDFSDQSEIPDPFLKGRHEQLFGAVAI